MITDLMTSLEKAVEDAQAKAKVLNDAESKVAVAQKEYSTAVALVEKLKSDLTAKIGDIFPSNRVRQV